MKRKVLMALAIIVGACICFSANTRAEVNWWESEDFETYTIDLTKNNDVKVVVLEIPKMVEREPEIELSAEEKKMIAGVVHSEANNQDMIGKRLIVDVILNRLQMPGFPKTIKGVIEQEGQFTAPYSYPSNECMEAVEKEVMERLDYEVLWFRTKQFSEYGMPLYIHNAHYFSGYTEEQIDE